MQVDLSAILTASAMGVAFATGCAILSILALARFWGAIKSALRQWIDQK